MWQHHAGWRADLWTDGGHGRTLPPIPAARQPYASAVLRRWLLLRHEEHDGAGPLLVIEQRKTCDEAKHADGPDHDRDQGAGHRADNVYMGAQGTAPEWWVLRSVPPTARTGFSRRVSADASARAPNGGDHTLGTATGNADHGDPAQNDRHGGDGLRRKPLTRE